MLQVEAQWQLEANRFSDVLNLSSDKNCSPNIYVDGIFQKKEVMKLGPAQKHFTQ